MVRQAALYRLAMEVVLCLTPGQFLADSISYRTAEPIRTNVIGSVAISVVDDVRVYDAYWWWIVRDDHGDVVGAALRTAPFGLQLGPMPVEAAQLLARAVAKVDDEFPWLAGPEALVKAFLRAYGENGSPGSIRGAVRGRKSLLYELIDLVVPDVEGSARPATVDDYDLVARWTLDFHQFIEGVVPAPNERDRRSLMERLASGSKRLWCAHGIVVSMAGHASPVATPSGLVTRVGPVFTPAEYRERGYGSAVTASLSATLHEGGSRVMLYADAANPTSNGIYQKIGYRLVDDAVQYDLVPIA